MTNIEIIVAEAIANNVYTEEEIMNILDSGRDLGLHTYQEWKRLGYQVQKGSKALFQARIWKPRKGMSLENFQLMSEEEQSEESKKGRFFLVKASFFGVSQVEKVVLN